MWVEIDELGQRLRSEYQMDQISSIPAIHSARKAYRALGKDPARYRLSAEALTRRVLKGEALYRLNNVVDLINFVSLKTGFSIGGYDADKIEGNVSLSIGKADDVYDALGRGLLNISSLPVLRDGIGVFGSPTSDSVRTGIQVETNNVLWVFFDFGTSCLLPGAMEFAVQGLMRYAHATEIKHEIIMP